MRDDEQIKMEIMLGMTQEEGPQCLLCLLPRCICHLTLEIAKIDYKLTQLRTLESKPKRKKWNRNIVLKGAWVDSWREEDYPILKEG